MKKILLTLVSITTIVCSANAMGPLGSAMTKHYRQGDHRTIVVPASNTTNKNAVLAPIRPCGYAVLGPIHPCGYAILGPIRPCHSA